MVNLDKLIPFWPACHSADQELTSDVATHGLRRPLLAYQVPNDFGGGAEMTGKLWLLDGRRRHQALKFLGHLKAPVLIIPAEITLGQALALALAQNQERGFNPEDMALLWYFLVNLEQAQVLSPGLPTELAPLLGLQSPKMRTWCLAAAKLPENGLLALATGGLDLENGARLASWKADDQQIILELFELLKPSKQKKRLWMDWLEDLSRQEKNSPAHILTSSYIVEALAEVDKKGRPAVEEAIRRYLWERRHPLLAGLVEARQARIKSLALPQNARLELDPTLEDTKFNLSLSFTTPHEFKTLAQVVSDLAKHQNFIKILDDCATDAEDTNG